MQFNITDKKMMAVEEVGGKKYRKNIKNFEKGSDFSIFLCN